VVREGELIPDFWRWGRERARAQAQALAPLVPPEEQSPPSGGGRNLDPLGPPLAGGGGAQGEYPLSGRGSPLG
jgi:hypothetical protein